MPKVFTAMRICKRFKLRYCICVCSGCGIQTGIITVNRKVTCTLQEPQFFSECGTVKLYLSSISGSSQL